MSTTGLKNKGIEMNCSICGQKDSYEMTLNGYNIFQCFKCSHKMTQPMKPDSHVAQTYSKDYFFSGGAGYPNYLDEKDSLTAHGRYYGNLINRYTNSTGKALDVGCAAGFILKGLTECGWDGQGIEPNEEMAEYARRNLNLKVKTGTAESYLPQKEYDLISLIQVIAHFIDPHKSIENLIKSLKSGGRIIIETWNYTSLTARLFGRHWHEYSPPSVLHWFSPNSLTLLMKKFDFKLVATDRPPKKIIGKHARTLISYKLPKHPSFSIIRKGLNIIPDNLLIPYPAEDLFWAIFKRN